VEKLGVTYEDEAVKTASTKKTKSLACPRCGGECIENNQFLMWCPNCGTEPFEKRPPIEVK
jgi:hypothetical protein